MSVPLGGPDPPERVPDAPLIQNFVDLSPSFERSCAPVKVRVVPPESVNDTLTLSSRPDTPAPAPIEIAVTGPIPSFCPIAVADNVVVQP